MGGYTFSCLLLSFHLLRMRYVRYSTAIWWVVLTFIYYTNDPNQCVLVFKVTHCNNVLFRSSISTNDSSIGCLDITKHK